MPWRYAFAFLWLGAASAQNLSFGIAAGGAPTDGFETINVPGVTYYSPSADYLAGATLEYRLPRSLSIEVDGIFRELHLAHSEGTRIGKQIGVQTSHQVVVTWEFPVLAKYRFHGDRLAPFIEAGPEFRTAGNLNEANPSHAGFAAGAGVETHWLGLDLAPTLRYTRWTRDANPYSPALSKPDQLEVFLGISRRPRSFGKPLGDRFSIGAIAGLTLTHDEPNSTFSGMIITQFPKTEPATGYSSGLDTGLVGAALELAIPER